ncbi:DsbC family protein [Crenothrix polyspora]|jgi:thiol:disulfide interchange protein DsbC|uniref:Thiol:disulfide interchange protein n=1 Tax=Crenothrix polyspora TaxID=360316 RepID=A0A1R4H0G0_9GAMM|nr:DsbC family protein [Crenothrix polyspora]SJM89694.1 Disulfide bond isomerase, DsbC/G [Crenothrix polyspora]
MKKLINLAVLSVLALAQPIAHADESAIRKALASSMPEAKIESIKPSEIKGLNEVMVGATIFYVSDDGKYLLQGKLIDIAGRKDLTEAKLGGARLQALEKIGTDNMLIFKPKIAKYTVSIFTDIDCGYCRKLHSEIDQYMAQGITIQYLLFPRAGKGSDSYNKAVAVWCAKDRNAALTAAKKDQKLDMKTCDNPIDKHMQLASDFDAKGTPMIVTTKGNIFPGYLPAKQLAEALAEEAKLN